jgi:hypothetical protein
MGAHVAEEEAERDEALPLEALACPCWYFNRLRAKTATQFNI